jgi:hypothetical protein
MKWSFEFAVQEGSMLKRLSAFVLEVLPYVLTTVIAAALIPGFVYSQLHGMNAVAMPSLSAAGEKVVALSRQSHAPQSTLPDR